MPKQSIMHAFFLILLHQIEKVTTVASPIDLSSGSESVRLLILEVLTSELNRFREEMRVEISRLDSRLDEISKRVDWR